MIDISVLWDAQRLLALLIQSGYQWMVVVTCGLIFLESSCIFTPHLPGDSLLFLFGMHSAIMQGNVIVSELLLLCVAVLGYTCNFLLGRILSGWVIRLGVRFAWIMRFMQRTRVFLSHHDLYAAILARFVPIVRTYMPFMLAVSGVRWPRFMWCNVLGGALWIGVLVSAGYWFGRVSWVQQNLVTVLCSIVFLSLCPVVYTYLRERGPEDE